MHARVDLRGLAAVVALAALALAAGCTTDPKMMSAPSQSSEDRFVGSQTCGACHQDAMAGWKQTYHSKMVRTTREGLLKDAYDNW